MFSTIFVLQRTNSIRLTNLGDLSYLAILSNCLEFSSYRIISVNNNNFYNSPRVVTSISVSCLIALAITSRIMLNISSYNEYLGKKNDHLVFLLVLSGMPLIYLSLSTMLLIRLRNSYNIK